MIQSDLDSVTSTSMGAWINTQFTTPMFSMTNVLLQHVNDWPDMKPYLWDSTWQQAALAPDQLRQRVRFALSEIFVVSVNGGNLVDDGLAMANYYDMLGNDAFGNFRQLMEDVTLHEAMGMYLNTVGNDGNPATGQNPDENYAREVMQLFTIGLVQLNPDATVVLDGSGNSIPTYDQSVVMGTAKVLTGWGYCWNNALTEWGFTHGYGYPSDVTPMCQYANHHSPLDKKIIGGTVLSGGASGEADLKALLDALFNHPNTGPFISSQLIQHLVTSNPTPAYIERVAAVFANNGNGVRGDMQALIRAILLDPEARQGTASNPAFGRLREPVQRVANLFRAASFSSPDGSFNVFNIGDATWNMAQNILSAPTVFNWFRPDYSPQGPLATQGLKGPEFQIENEYTIPEQTGSILQFSWNGFWQNGPTPDLSRWMAFADDPTGMVNDLDLIFTGGVMSDESKQTIITAVQNTPTTVTNYPLERAKTAIYLVLNTPDYMIQK